MSGQNSLSRRERHAEAIKQLLAGGDVSLSATQMLMLLTHLQANVLFQKRMTTALASVASGETEWDAIEQAAEAAVFSEDALERFIFDLAAGVTSRD